MSYFRPQYSKQKHQATNQKHPLMRQVSGQHIKCRGVVVHVHMNCVVSKLRPVEIIYIMYELVPKQHDALHNACECLRNIIARRIRVL